MKSTFKNYDEKYLLNYFNFLFNGQNTLDFLTKKETIKYF